MNTPDLPRTVALLIIVTVALYLLALIVLHSLPTRIPMTTRAVAFAVLLVASVLLGWWMGV